MDEGQLTYKVAPIKNIYTQTKAPDQSQYNYKLKQGSFTQFTDSVLETVQPELEDVVTKLIVHGTAHNILKEVVAKSSSKMELDKEELIHHLTSESSYHSMQFGDVHGGIVEPCVFESPKVSGKLVRALRSLIDMKMERLKLAGLNILTILSLSSSVQI